MTRTRRLSGIIPGKHCIDSNKAEFLTLWDVQQDIASLAMEHPARVTVRSIGKSAMGRDILCHSIGNGPKRALLIAWLSPDEPLGAATLSAFGRLLCGRGDVCPEYTFHMVSCADPDGALLNEDWLSGPFDLYQVARRCYRPEKQQTLLMQHLTRLIDEVQPDFLSTLRNSLFEGPPFAGEDEALLSYANGNGRPCAGGTIGLPLFVQQDSALLLSILMGAREGMRSFIECQLRALEGQLPQDDPFTTALREGLSAPLSALYAPAHLLGAIQQAFETACLKDLKALETAYAVTDARLRLLCEAVDAAEYHRPRIDQLCEKQLKALLEAIPSAQ